jgi:hypothetical protein
MLDGRKDFIDVGRNTPLRLNGSMTVTAWIKPTSFPVDDAAIVSQFDSGFGYQFDTTVDRGPRTIGFKLTNACGDLMARYKTTPLAANVWHHVAGVYDSEKKALDVYLNGELDNGFLLGSITATQRSSRAPVYLGKRTDLEGFDFAGSLDDVRIYSIALTSAEIDTVMRGSPVVRASTPGNSHQTTGLSSYRNEPCAVLSEPYDKNIPIAAAAIGVLAAIGRIGLCPNAKPLFHLGRQLRCRSADPADLGIRLTGFQSASNPFGQPRRGRFRSFRRASAGGG